MTTEVTCETCCLYKCCIILLSLTAFQTRKRYTLVYLLLVIVQMCVWRTMVVKWLRLLIMAVVSMNQTFTHWVCHFIDTDTRALFCLVSRHSVNPVRLYNGYYIFAAE